MLEFFHPGKITFNLEDGYLWRRHFHDLKGCLALYKILEECMDADDDEEYVPPGVILG